MKKIIVFLLLLITIINLYSLESKGNLIVIVKDLRNNDGVVLLAIYSSEEGFPGQSENAVQRQSVTIKNGVARAVFTDCAYRTYAVAVIHDENNNGKMDEGLFGIPVEGYGFSNDATGIMGPASFEDSSFNMSQQEKEITIKATY